MQGNGGFSRVDLLVTVVIAAGLVYLVFAMDGCRARSRRLQNGTQVRGIQQGLATYPSGSGSYYPGVNPNRIPIGPRAASPKQYGFAAPSDSDQSASFAIMLTNQYFTPQFAISPKESVKAVRPVGPVENSITITQNHYSYSLLQYAGPNNAGRREEWGCTENSRAPAVADRSKAIDPALTTTSLHTRTMDFDSTHWQGNIAWNDNHVTFESTGVFPARWMIIGTARLETEDDLFIASGEDDAKMAYR